MDAFGLFDEGKADVVGELGLLPVDSGRTVACFDPDVAGTADDFRRHFVLFQSAAVGAGCTQRADALTAGRRHDALDASLDPVVTAPLQQQTVEEHRC